MVYIGDKAHGYTCGQRELMVTLPMEKKIHAVPPYYNVTAVLAL